MVPILKKGDPKDPKNYRPVSCLAAASKVLEKIVCDQLTRFVETNKILPDNQHGFRKGRSTMTALSAMQKEWIQNTEQGLTTGVLVWDLSAAFDMIDIELFIRKLTLYGAYQKTRNWFESFLSGRTQRVRIGDALSSPVELASGVPQGGILSPIIFTLYTADLEFWLSTSRAFNFADDTTTDNKSKDKNEVRSKLEVDAKNVLSFMASNGLVANQSKTEFLLLNEKKRLKSTDNRDKGGGHFHSKDPAYKTSGNTDRGVPRVECSPAKFDIQPKPEALHHSESVAPHPEVQAYERRPQPMGQQTEIRFTTMHKSPTKSGRKNTSAYEVTAIITK